MAPRTYFPILVLILAASFFAYDITSDLASSDESRLHIGIESLVFLLSVTALLMEIRRVLQLRAALVRDRKNWQAYPANCFRSCGALSATWGLSPSESDVALLLLKGLSMREIAEPATGAGKNHPRSGGQHLCKIRAVGTARAGRPLYRRPDGGGREMKQWPPPIGVEPIFEQSVRPSMPKQPAPEAA